MSGLPNAITLGRLVLVAAVRLLTLAVTWQRHGRVAIVHTWGNKAAGLALFAAVPVALLVGRLPGPVLAVVLVVCLAAAIDELVLVRRATSYDVDARGSWELRRRARTAPRASSP